MVFNEPTKNAPLLGMELSQLMDVDLNNENESTQTTSGIIVSGSVDPAITSGITVGSQLLNGRAPIEPHDAPGTSPAQSPEGHWRGHQLVWESHPSRMQAVDANGKRICIENGAKACGEPSGHRLAPARRRHVQSHQADARPLDDGARRSSTSETSQMRQCGRRWRSQTSPSSFLKMSRLGGFVRY